MATSYSPSIVRSGLVLYIDPENERSFPGSPITNYFYLTNPRIDSSYASYVRVGSGTWLQKHPDAITVYDVNGNNISDYSNTGVADWTNVYHAIWTYDYTLKKPVVTIRNHDAGTWKAKYFSGASMNFSALGMTVGSQYTISWLQWTDNINRAANVGLYTRDNSNVQSFWDGLSANSTTTKNTKVGTWQRVYHTYTVSASRNLSDTSTLLYMYGYEYGTGTIKISDVQIELFPTPSNFSYNQTRGSTVAAGGGMINLSSSLNNGEIFNNVRQTIYSPKSLVLNGSNHYISFTPPLTAGQTQYSMSAWWRATSIGNQVIYEQNSSTLLGSRRSAILLTSSGSWGFNGESNDAHDKVPTKLNQWVHGTITVDKNLGSNEIKIYENGVLYWQGSPNGGATNLNIGGDVAGIGRKMSSGTEYFPGSIGPVSVYNRVLTAAEVRQNYNATKGRYGL